MNCACRARPWSGGWHRPVFRCGAYPYGDADDLVLESMLRNGFELGVTVNPGGNAFYADPLLLRRTMIFGDHDLEAFKARVQIRRTAARP